MCRLSTFLVMTIQCCVTCTHLKQCKAFVTQMIVQFSSVQKSRKNDTDTVSASSELQKSREAQDNVLQTRAVIVVVLLLGQHSVCSALYTALGCTYSLSVLSVYTVHSSSSASKCDTYYTILKHKYS
jgi:hypothetical protein